MQSMTNTTTNERRATRRTLGLLLGCCVLSWGALVYAEAPLPQVYEGVDVADSRGRELPLDATFRNSAGETVRLGSFFGDGVPVLLTLNYYECESVCSTQLNHLLRSVEDIDLDGDEFRIVTVSFDPEEGPELAAAADAWKVSNLERTDVEWNFLVGEPEQITTLAEAVGFEYRYDELTDQYAHGTAVYVGTPEGTISQVIYGIAYPPRDLGFALIEASEGRVGSALQRVLLSCFHYSEGTYSLWAFGVMRLGGAIIVLVLGTALALLWRRERHGRHAEATT